METVIELYRKKQLRRWQWVQEDICYTFILINFAAKVNANVGSGCYEDLARN